MNFDLTEDQIAIQDVARAFTADRIAPNAEQWDAEKHWPADVAREAGDLGFGSIYLGEDMGGVDLTRVESAIIFEQLSQGCPSTAAMISIHNMAAWMIDAFGSNDLREKYVPTLARLDTMASYCLTEPGAGSDAASIKTRAVLDGDDYVLNGNKAFISGGGVSDVYVVMARTGGEGPKGISCFVVDKDAPGLSFGAQERKMGWKSQPTCALNFDNCRIPAENLVGKEGDGFKIAMKGLDGGRLNIAACSLGGAQRAMDEAVSYVRERKQFGKAIADFQAIQFRLADMATELEAARLMLYSAAQKVSDGAHGATTAAAMAKRFVTDVCFNVVNDALQLHGGYGYLSDYPIERLLRDVRVHQILEGTNEIMRVIISRDVLKD